MEPAWLLSSGEVLEKYGIVNYVQSCGLNEQENEGHFILVTAMKYVLLLG